jgi:transformation/transcription domain-associated protein
MSKLLRSCILSLAFFAPVAGPNAPTLSAEVLDRLKIAEGNVEKIVTMVCLMLAETHPHTFQEIWTLNMDFFFEQTYKRQYILHVAQFLLLREDTSSMLLPILLKYLTARLEGLGDREEENATVLVRAFRLVFQSVVKFSSKNQGFLSSHLTKIIMDSFPLAVKAKHPSNYYSLVRALFRTMGLNISSMDILFNELVAVLPELLACLHQQLHVVDAGSRDQIVELFLNIPVRLTNLLPHLSFLMRPLAFALRGTNELMSLGLRTLELCIDHLTADFLDPILDTEIRDIHTALFAILQTPVSPHASSVIKILGKLGGRNRKLLYMDPVLSWRTNTSVATMTLPFDGNFQEINIEPAFHLAKETLARVSSTPANKADAFQFIQTTLVVLLQNVSMLLYMYKRVSYW